MASESYYQKISKEFRFSSARSGGPGGQHVNKTETKVILKWAFEDSSATSELRKQRIREKLQNSINSRGEIVIDCDQFRSKKRNQEACEKKLVQMLEKAFYIAPKRKKTKISKSVKAKNLKLKRAHGEKKALRKKVKY